MTTTRMTIPARAYEPGTTRISVAKAETIAILYISCGPHESIVTMNHAELAELHATIGATLAQEAA